ncbi:MAG TPA: tRNA preQ1(34) S-adenosylmethionine ribosyltransferase-isomerase QueA [Gemmatimonadaceae bacterium]|nr:tRNA preQ1(34) S-adenosylmethionine ribosyltransferase-isomerase QueA [Gemmatimonadaceae bacterium]
MPRDGSRTSDYHFELPPELIAQEPLAERDASRLMVLRRSTGEIEHRAFRDLPELFDSGDVLVRNVSRVIRARVLGTRASGAPGEVLLLRPLGDGTWEAMVHPGGKLRPGKTLHVAPDLEVEILSITERRTRTVALHSSLSDEDAIERYGHVPLPPYITRTDRAADAERYQTVYAKERGSVAAPTAGLHFTENVLQRITRRGITLADVVLHVGAGTFKPVEVDDPAQHVMHEETFTVPASAAETLNSTRAAGGAVIALGTTAARTLESAVRLDGSFVPDTAATGIFIRPPYSWRTVDRLITNFHLPRSTLIMLVAAFAGYDFTMRAYQEAVREQYRFFSYGDAMVVL